MQLIGAVTALIVVVTRLAAALVATGHQQLEHGFFPNSTEARSLFRSCTSTINGAVRFQWSGQTPPLIIVGAQKAGTTTLYDILAGHTRRRRNAGKRHKTSFCPTGMMEPHVFDQQNFALAPLLPLDVMDYRSKWPNEPFCKRTDVHFEKTPDYLTQTWAAKRLCESIPEPKLVVALREPAARAYSSFYQAATHEAILDPPARGTFPPTPQGFHQHALLETEVVTRCGFTPDGEPEVDAAAGARYASCCESVAAARGRPHWSGCSCDLSVPPGESRFMCTFFGHKSAAPIRGSIYVHSLRILLRYHRPDHILIYGFRSLSDLSGVARDIDSFARESSRSGVLELALPEAEPEHSNAGRYEPMLKETRDLLEAFYAPYNRELLELLGRERIEW